MITDGNLLIKLARPERKRRFEKREGEDSREAAAETIASVVFMGVTEQRGKTYTERADFTGIKQINGREDKSRC